MTQDLVRSAELLCRPASELDRLGTRTTTRRECIKLAFTPLAIGVTCATPVEVLAQQTASLKAAAAAKNIRYGALADVNLSGKSAFRDLFLKQCALCAVDIWAPSFSNGPNALQFDSSENACIVAAAECGLPITGAHLLWYYHMPSWFTHTSGQKEATNAVVDYAYGIANHYRGKAWSWNVVNEALNPKDGQSLGLRSCWPLQRIGPDYIDMTFRAAERADPSAILAYNDSDMELDTPEQEDRRTALLHLLDDMLRRKTPIRAVGLQSHLKFKDFGQFRARRYRAFLGEIAARGLSIILTELDVLDVGAPSDIIARDRAVAHIYSHFLATALDEPAVKGVVTWGLSDRYSWLNTGSDKAFVRSDGLPARPLPFDQDLKRTPVLDAILNAFDGAPQRMMV